MATGCAHCHKAGPEHTCSGGCGRCFCSAQCQQAEWLATPAHRLTCCKLAGDIIADWHDTGADEEPPANFVALLAEKLHVAPLAAPALHTMAGDEEMLVATQVLRRFLHRYYKALAALVGQVGGRMWFADEPRRVQWLAEIRSDILENNGVYDATLAHQMWRYLPSDIRAIFLGAPVPEPPERPNDVTRLGSHVFAVLEQNLGAETRAAFQRGTPLEQRLLWRRATKAILSGIFGRSEADPSEYSGVQYVLTGVALVLSQCTSIDEAARLFAERLVPEDPTYYTPETIRRFLDKFRIVHEKHRTSYSRRMRAISLLYIALRSRSAFPW